jgi:hypothetical protein
LGAGEFAFVGVVAGDHTKLVALKALHTAIWLFFAGCTVAIPAAAAMRRFVLAVVLAGFVLVECLVLAANGWRCPITDLASRYTDDRRPNFDIFLPECLARHNKVVFGTIFAVDLVFLIWQFQG